MIRNKNREKPPPDPGMSYLLGNRYCCRGCGKFFDLRKPGTILFLSGHKPAEMRLVGPEDSCILLEELPFELFLMKDDEWNKRSPHWCSPECLIEWANKIAKLAKEQMDQPLASHILNKGGLGREGRKPFVNDLPREGTK